MKNHQHGNRVNDPDEDTRDKGPVKREGICAGFTVSVLLEDCLSVEGEVGEFHHHEAAENEQSVGALWEEHVDEKGNDGDGVVSGEPNPHGHLVVDDDDEVTDKVGNSAA